MAFVRVLSVKTLLRPSFFLLAVLCPRCVHFYLHSLGIYPWIRGVPNHLDPRPGSVTAWGCPLRASNLTETSLRVDHCKSVHICWVTSSSNEGIAKLYASRSQRSFLKCWITSPLFFPFHDIPFRILKRPFQTSFLKPLKVSWCNGPN